MCIRDRRLVEQSFPVKIYARGSSLSVRGDDERLIKKLENLLVQYAELSLSGHKFNSAEIRYGLHSIQKGEEVDLRSLYNDVVCISNRGKAIRPYTNGQKGYIQAIRDNDITFGIGPAGTGKTYLAVAQAVAYLKSAKISRIILVRPVVEAGERLGYLPGDMNEKVAPYLRPLYDAFYELLPAERFDRYFEKGVIELAPLAYMRGRTLNDSFIILDEAQNTTPEQMKMFLTRLGFGSKAVITGDITQVDLPGTKESGLKVVQDLSLIHIFANVEASKGVKEGGLLTHAARLILVEVQPSDIPEEIVVDAKDLEMGSEVFVKDLDVPEGVTVLTDPEILVLHISAIRSSDDETEEGEEESKEVEVVAKGKAAKEEE